MVWALDLDDFMGHCGAGPYPLLRAVNVALGVPLGNHTVTPATLSSSIPSRRSRPGFRRPPAPPRRRHPGKAVDRPRQTLPTQRPTTTLPVVSHSQNHSQLQQQKHEQEHEQQPERTTAATLLSLTSQAPSAQGLQLLQRRILLDRESSGVFRRVTSRPCHPTLKVEKINLKFYCLILCMKSASFIMKINRQCSRKYFI